MKFFIRLHNRELQRIADDQPARAGTPDARDKDCGSYAPLEYPDRSSRLSSCGLAVSATRQD
jgi:hypothetical protein